jgi:hypothetical protein
MLWIEETSALCLWLLTGITAGIAPLLVAATLGSPGPDHGAPDQEDRLEEKGLPDGSEDRDPSTARERRFLSVLAGFSYLIALFIGLVIIAIAYAVMS